MGISQLLMDNYLKQFIHVSKQKHLYRKCKCVMNAVITEGKPVGESVLQGEGAGPGPTSSSLLSDLLSILRVTLNIHLEFHSKESQLKHLIMIITQIIHISDLK